MNSTLWVSKTGLSAQDTALRTISNNLANVGTVGYKKDRAVFEDLVYQINQQPGAQSSQDSTLPTGVQLGTGVRVAATQKQFSIGALQTTERALDMAIEGRGFFQISMPDGSIAYTRTGSFSVNQDGDIVTSQGYTLEPAVNIPQGSSSLTIGRDGTVSTVTNGTLTQVGNLQVVDFVNPTGLEAVGGNLYKETVASGAPLQTTPGLNGTGEVVQGVLESSNVSVVEEMVSMVATQRAYEMNARVVSTADQMLQYLAQNI